MFDVLHVFLRRLFRRNRFERELTEELTFHLDARVEDLVRRGFDPTEARRRARIEFGGVEHYKERVRTARPGAWLDTLVQDVRLSARRLRQEPAFATAVALTLSLGIGASTAVFGMASATLASRMPYAAADRLVVGGSTWEGKAPEVGFVSGLDYFDYRESNRSFESLAAFSPFCVSLTVTGGGDPWEVEVTSVTWNLLRTLRVDPFVGRHFQQEEEAQPEVRSVLISFGLWQRRFGGTRDVVGRTFVLDGSPHTIIGVLPRGFRFVGVGSPGNPGNGLQTAAEVWRVLARPGEVRDRHNYHLVGRLKAGLSMAQAQRDVDAISRLLERAYPDSNKGKGLRLLSLQEYVGGDVRSGLLLPAAATVCLLFIACANVAGLLLARGQRRLAEAAMRSALGASRSRLVRQQLTESVVLTLPAGVLGIGVAYVLQRLLLHLLPVGGLGITRPVMDGLVLLFAFVTSVATGLLVGVVPAVRRAAVGLSPQLVTVRTGFEGGRGARLRRALLVAQVAISVVLLVGFGLVARSLVRLSSVDLGFSAKQVFTARIEIPRSAYRKSASRQAFFTTVLQEVRALPGVRSAGATTNLPILEPGNIWRTRTPDRPVTSPEAMEHTHLRRVMPGYFATMSMPLVKGRDILETDREDAPAVAVLSESLARKLYPRQDPVGRTVLLLVYDNVTRSPKDIPYPIVGVVRSARLANPRDEADPAMYLPMLQAGPLAARIVVHTAGDPQELAVPIREIVRRHDRNVLVSDVQTMESVVDGAFTDFRMMVGYLGLFAGIALFLAAVGLYGALTYDVSQQAHEIGVRVAMGATRAGILALVLRRGAWLVAIGAAAGMAAAYPGTRLVRHLLFETVALDLGAYAGAALVLGVVAATACLVPALRATRVDAAVVLRGE
jgi:putative ABC transport system permease protein